MECTVVWRVSPIRFTNMCCLPRAHPKWRKACACLGKLYQKSRIYWHAARLLKLDKNVTFSPPVSVQIIRVVFYRNSSNNQMMCVSNLFFKRDSVKIAKGWIIIFVMLFGQKCLWGGFLFHSWFPLPKVVDVFVMRDALDMVMTWHISHHPPVYQAPIV